MQGELGQPFLVALLLGHVVHGHHGTEPPAGLVDEDLAVDHDLARAAVVRLEQELHVPQLLAGQGTEQRVLVRGQLGTVGPPEPEVDGHRADRVVIGRPTHATGAPPG